MIERKKYIIINGKPLVFDIDFRHADMITDNTKVCSAGFVTLWKRLDGIKIICNGESTSLSISSRPVLDEILIAKHLNLY